MGTLNISGSVPHCINTQCVVAVSVRKQPKRSTCHIISVFIRDDVKIAVWVKAQDCPSRGRRFDSGKNSKHRELKSTFEHIELAAKLLDYFLRSNKSNINQSMQGWFDDMWLNGGLYPGTKDFLNWFMIAFITWNSNLVPLLEGLCTSNPCRFELTDFWVFAGIESATSGLTVPRSDQLSWFYIVSDDVRRKTSFIFKTQEWYSGNHWLKVYTAQILLDSSSQYWSYFITPRTLWLGGVSGNRIFFEIVPVTWHCCVCCLVLINQYLGIQWSFRSRVLLAS